MKDPTDLHYETDAYERDDWEGSESMCDSCLEPWPCKRIQKWWKSDTYRLQEAERHIENLTKARDRQAKALSELREQQHMLNLFVRGGLLPAVRDLLDGRPGGVIKEDVQVEYQDLTSWDSSAIQCVAGARTYTVEYESSTGLWRNGDCVERRYSK